MNRSSFHGGGGGGGGEVSKYLIIDSQVYGVSGCRACHSVVVSQTQVGLAAGSQ